MWVLRTMTMAILAMVGVLPWGGRALPTYSTNDRPIIGILAQEIHSPLADALIEVLANERALKVQRLNSQGFSNIERDVGHTKESHPEPLVGWVELSRELEYQKEIAAEKTATGLDQEVRSRNSTDQSLKPETDPASSSILALSVDTTTQPPHPPIPKNASYIAASYVKFVEAGGARVVPIFVNRNRDYYEHLLKSINGVLFPGGAVAIDETSPYGRAGKIIYEIAKSMNDEREVFPLWGTCLGFELMMGLAANGQEIRAQCDAQNTANRLKLDAEYADGYLLRHLPKRLIKALTAQHITSNFHTLCLTPKNFSAFGVDKTYRALAYSADRRGVEYIAVAEAWNYPFFAVQFHPEKNPYEWTTKPGHNHIPHSSFAVDTANHFAQVYVNYARRSKHRFTTQAEEEASLIYNYSPLYTGQYAIMEQIYVF